MVLIFEYIVVLPYTVKAAALPDEDGNFTIYINARLTREQQIKAAQHELKHIKKDHFYDDIKTVAELEHEAMV